MRISDRFIDYGTTGAFFLIGQFILLALWGQPVWLLSLLSHVTVAPSLQSTFNSLIVALGITAIFFFGLILDLLGSIFFPMRLEELGSFKNQVETNKEWLQLWGQENAYLQKSYEEFQTAYSDLDWRAYMSYSWKRLRQKARDVFPHRQVAQNHPAREESADEIVVTSAKKQDYGRLNHNYTKLRYYVQSYILINSGLQQLDTLTDQIHLWRTSRSISLATAIWLGEATIALVIGLVATIVAIFGQFFPSLLTFFLFVLIWVVLLALTVLTLGMARSAFSRMCSTMFSLAQITYTNKRSTKLTDNTTSDIEKA